jgi:hypothetical protein
MWFLSLWDRFTGGVWKSLEKHTRETLECCKQSFVVILVAVEKNRVVIEM